MNSFDDKVDVQQQLDAFLSKCKPGTVIKKLNGKYNQKDALVFFNGKLVGIIECKKRNKIYTDWILEVKKVKHWLESYPDLDFIYLNRTPLGDYYLNVACLKIKKYIKNNAYMYLDGSKGIQFKIGSREDRGLDSDKDREWLMISNKFFKKI